MSAVTKPLAKGFQSFRKFSLGQQAQRALIGDKAYDKLHFISTGTIKNAAAIDQAEADKKTAEDLAAEARAQQATQLAELDNEENRRIKKLLSGGRGMRGYRGGSMFRQAPSNSPGPRSAAGGGSASPGAAAMRAGGANGGLGGFRRASTPYA